MEESRGFRLHSHLFGHFTLFDILMCSDACWKFNFRLWYQIYTFVVWVPYLDNSDFFPFDISLYKSKSIKIIESLWYNLDFTSPLGA
jgi:hypothetical protein